MKNIVFNPASVQLLYWSHCIDYFTDAWSHAHPFWQIEVFLGGEMEGTRETETLLLTKNSIFVIPPENVHNFRRRKDAGNEFFSFKFKLDPPPLNLQSILVEENEFSRNICRILKLLLSTESSTKLLSLDKQTLVEYLLGNIVDYCLTKYLTTPSLEESPIIRKICEFIRTDGKNVNVEYVSKVLNCSTSRLRVHVKKVKGLSAKNFIDQECINIVKQHLTYSSLSLTQIAEMMRFPDIYAFSRFFKRMCKISPSNYRNSVKSSSRLSLR